MTATRVAVAGGLVALIALCLLAAIGFTAVLAPLVTVFMLLVLVAGGNLLSPRGPRGR